MTKIARYRNPQSQRLESLAQYETRLALAAEKRKPTEADAPPVTPFPGKRIKPTPGQLDVFGGVVE